MKTQKTQYTEPTEPARPGDTVNFKYVENYDPKKYCRNVSGGLDQTSHPAGDREGHGL